MSFYRSLLAAAAAIVIASPVFADDTAANNQNAQNPADQSGAPVAQQLADNAAAPADQNAQQPAAAQQSADASSTQVNVNTASVKDLMKVKGVNASKAKAIVSYRKKHGDFKSVDDLSKVKGFSKLKPAKLKAIQDQLTAG